MMNRRVFIQSATLVAVTPTLVALFPLSHEPRPSVSAFMPSVPPVTGNGVSENTVVFKIDGWDCAELNGPTKNQVSIRISQSWRTTWR